jgi:hypothetical protein
MNSRLCAAFHTQVGQPVAMNGGHAFAEYCTAPERRCRKEKRKNTQAVNTTLAARCCSLLVWPLTDAEWGLWWAWVCAHVCWLYIYESMKVKDRTAPEIVCII